MQSVAHHLQQQAVKLSSSKNAQCDAFARSSFNRYYYSVYLEVRQTLFTLDRKWGTAAHKTVPMLLRGQVGKEIRKINARARKLNDTATIQLCDRATAAIARLAGTMEQANAVRIVADYEPSTVVVFSNSTRFSLNQVSVNDAHSWHSSVKIDCGLIMTAWKIANV